MRKRKKAYIDPEVQGMLVRRLLLHWVVFLAVASLVTYCLQVLSDPFQSNRERFLQIWWTHGPFLMVLLCLLPVFIVDTVRFSHRFVGPIYRLRQSIRSSKVQEGDLPMLKLRDSDFWHGLAEDFNQMVKRVSNLNPVSQKCSKHLESGESDERAHDNRWEIGDF